MEDVQNVSICVVLGHKILVLGQYRFMIAVNTKL